MKRPSKKSPTSAGGAPASVATGGNATTPAHAAAVHNPLPWSLVLGVYPGAATRVMDAHGATVLQCPKDCTDVDLANLELIVGAVNCRSISELREIGTHTRPEAAAPAFRIHHDDRDEIVDPRSAAGIGGA